MTDTDDTPSEITLRVMRDRDTHDGSIYDEAQKLRARIEQLEAALKPFAMRAEFFEGRKNAHGDNWSDDTMYADDPPSDLYIAQLRAARDVLAISSFPTPEKT